MLAPDLLVIFVFWHLNLYPNRFLFTLNQFSSFPSTSLMSQMVPICVFVRIVASGINGKVTFSASESVNIYVTVISRSERFCTRSLALFLITLPFESFLVDPISHFYGSTETLIFSLRVKISFFWRVMFILIIRRFSFALAISKLRFLIVSTP